MPNMDGRLFNVDRWTIYTLQKLYPKRRQVRSLYLTWGGTHLEPTPRQFRRMRKKMFKNQDYSIVLTPKGIKKY